MGVIARPVADAAFTGGISPLTHRADVDMNGGEFDRLARDLGLYRAESGGIAVDADDPPHLPRRRHRGFTAAEFEQRSQRSEEHTSELQSLMRISYAVFCLKKKKHKKTINTTNNSIIYVH